MKINKTIFVLFCAINTVLNAHECLVSLSGEMSELIQQVTHLIPQTNVSPAIQVVKYAQLDGYQELSSVLVLNALIEMQTYLEMNHLNHMHLHEQIESQIISIKKMIANQVRSRPKVINNLCVTESVRVNNLIVQGSIQGTFAGNCISTLTGLTGFTGQTGLTGNAGLQEQAQGPTGFSGAIGQTGQTGNSGNTGAQGSRGALGAIGNTGPTGFTGFTGFTGMQGAVGQQGPTGNTGPAGGSEAYAYIYSTDQSVVPFASTIPLATVGLVVNMAVTSDSIIFLSDGIYEITYQVNGFKTGSSSSNEIQIRAIDSSNSLFNAATYGAGSSTLATTRSRPMNGQFIAVVNAGDSVRLLNNTGTITNTLTLQHAAEFPGSVTASLYVRKLL
ncbi:MAG: collagen-like triple helix repeat-containing protein [Candidatus Dependentiae bacterium]